MYRSVNSSILDNMLGYIRIDWKPDNNYWLAVKLQMRLNVNPIQYYLKVICLIYDSIGDRCLLITKPRVSSITILSDSSAKTRVQTFWRWNRHYNCIGTCLCTFENINYSRSVYDVLIIDDWRKRLITILKEFCFT